MQIRDGENLFVKEENLPLIEFALWLSKWLADDSLKKEKIFSFYPDSMESEIFQLVFIGGSQYCLSYYEKGKISLLKADYTAFQAAFTQFIFELGKALQDRYNLQFENILLRFIAPAQTKL